MLLSRSAATLPAMHALVRLAGKDITHGGDALDVVFGGNHGDPFGDVAPQFPRRDAIGQRGGRLVEANLARASIRRCSSRMAMRFSCSLMCRMNFAMRASISARTGSASCAISGWIPLAGAAGFTAA